MKNHKSNIENIKNYYNRIANLTIAGGTKNETSIRKAFLEMVEKYAKELQLAIVDELQQYGTRNYPDAGLQSPIGLNFGYIENNGIYDDIEAEIAKKIDKGYDLTNIIFENSQWLVLYQNKTRVFKGYIGETDFVNSRISEAEFERVIKQFITFEPQFYWRI